MSTLLSFTILGLFTGAAYAIAASGLVLTYTTTRVFNIAHGAFGMVMAFTFWDLSQRQGMPTWLSLVLVLGVIAPATGWFVQRFVTRGLGEGPVSVSLVVTVGLFVGLIGLAQYVWPPEPRTVPPFLPDKGVQIGDTYVTAHQIITIALSAVVALGLYLLLNRTRVGTAMRASVDNPVLLRLFGGKPDRVASLSWAIGISLAALAGILLTPVIGLSYYDLTLLVINAYAAAMLGQLKSLPLTFVGAMGLGILQSFAVAYLPTDGNLAGLRAVVPALFLFAVIVVMPQAQLRIGQVKGIVSAPVPSLVRSGVWGAALLVLVAMLAAGLSNADLLLVGTAATYAMVMLSLVLLTGYGGHVSLAQFTFAGVGALAYAKLDEPNLYGLGHGFESLGSYVLVMVAFFVLMAVGLLVLRRGALGRVLIAMRDSPAACGTLGLDMRWFRVGLFGLSAAMAGLAGGLFAGLRGTVGAADFQFFNSLPLLLLAVVCGVTSVTGATLGGIGLMLLPVLQSSRPELAGLVFAVLGFGAVALGRDPNGLANLLFGLGRRLDRRFGDALRRAVPVLPLPRDRADDGAAPDIPLKEDLQEVGVHATARG